MPKISNAKKEKISEQILHHLFSTAPKPAFTSQIAEEIARDEEFTLMLLKELKAKSLVLEVNKNIRGNEYIRRKRWLLSNPTYQAYFQRQGQQHNNL